MLQLDGCKLGTIGKQNVSLLKFTFDGCKLGTIGKKISYNFQHHLIYAILRHVRPPTSCLNSGTKQENVGKDMKIERKWDFGM